MDLFDVIGPVMIGPSSSHTAGAARIGRVVRLLLGETPRMADIGLYGSFAKTYQGHGTDRALVGGLMGMAVDDPRLRDSLTLAKDAGIRLDIHPITLRGAHPNTAILRVTGESGRTVTVQAASIGGGEIMIQRIDGMEAGFSGHENTLVVTHRDVEGMIAKVAGEIAGSEINIATMRTFRSQQGGVGLMVIELDKPADDALISRIRALRGVFHISYLTKQGG